jgi:hypothetical protein
MAIQIASDLIPAGGGTFYLLEDIYTKGGLQVQDSIAKRDLIPVKNLKVGSLVLTLADKKIWMATKVTFPSRQDPDAVESVEWEELEMGGGSGGGGGAAGSRQVAIHTSGDLQVDEIEEFEVKMGASAIMLKLETNRPTRILAFGTPDKSEINPYEFISTADHLSDDGRQQLADGTIFRTRNYSILSNNESPVSDTIYFTINNIEPGKTIPGEPNEEGVPGPSTVEPVIVTITYVTIEVPPSAPLTPETPGFAT